MFVSWLGIVMFEPRLWNW